MPGNLVKPSFFGVLLRKIDPHIRILAAFPGSRQGKLCAENDLSLNTFGGHLMRCKSALFWQSEHYSASVFARTETDGFAGLSGTGLDTVEGNGVRFGLISPVGLLR
jgi:hypothetical protein